MVHFLSDNPGWVHEHQNEAKRNFSLLASANLDDTAKKTYAVLGSRYPKLFPQVTITSSNPNREVPIPKIRLMSLSSKFHTTLSSITQEGLSQKITIDTDRFSSEAVLVFLEFLKSGKLKDLENHVAALLILADEHNIPTLKEPCIECIKRNLDVDQLPEMLQLALNLNLKELTWFCLSFGLQQGRARLEEKAIFDFLDPLFNQPLDAVRPLFQCLKEMTWLEKPPTLNDIGEISFIDLPHDLSFLATLNQFLPITKIVIENPNSKEQFEEILKICPNLQTLHINYPDFKIKEDVATLKKLNLQEFCNKGSFLNSMQEVKEYLEELTPVIVNSLNLKKISGITDENLIELSKKLPKLKKLSVSSFEIKKIPFEFLEEINCSCCFSLIELSLPLAQKVDCSHCKSLINVFLPLVKTIECVACTSLLQLSLPLAEKVYCSTCIAMTQLFLPVAKIIICPYNPVLTLLEAPLATKVFCSKCSALTRILLPQALEISCWKCSSLMEITALLAEKIFCRKCPKIKLNVSKNCVIETNYDEDPPLWTLGNLNLDSEDITGALDFMQVYPKWFNTHKSELHPFLSLLANSAEYAEYFEDYSSLYENFIPSDSSFNLETQK